MMARVSAVLDHQRGHLVPWVPIFLSIGIGAYFALPSEPSATAWWCLAGAIASGALALALGAWRWPLFWAVFLVAFGFGMAGARTQAVSGPVLEWRYYGPVEGRIIAIDRSASDKVRLTLDRVVLKRVSPGRTPTRVRVSLHGEQRWLDPEPGQTIIVTAHLGPPEGPVEPGGFDFQRMAWFKQLGAVGYTRTPALLLEPATGALPVERLRRAISTYVQEVLPGEPGAFAAAITTGDRSAMGAETLEALRASNLAHLLAISGLHMGLLTGFVFLVLRTGLAAFPPLVLRVSTKKIAAIGALAAGAFYLAMSGGNVATQRAFIQAAVMLVAVLLDRRAVTLRAVAMAAIIVLVLRAEALTEPGFQMSFAATTALVAAFRFMRTRTPDWLPRWARPVLGLLISSGVAGAATAPIAAAHFNQIPQYGLLANMLSVPLMGSIVMPAAVLAACLAPFGLAWIGLYIMEPAIRWIMGVAHWVAGIDGALSRVPSPDWMVIPLFSLGMLWLILWQGRARLGGLAPAAMALVLWAGVQRPDVLISPSGGLVGVMTPEGRALSKPKGDGFAARSWLENDGTLPSQEVGAARPGFEGERGEAWFAWADTRAVHVTGRAALSRAQDLCEPGRLIVVNTEWEGAASCEVVDARRLKRDGAVALYWDGARARVVTTRMISGKRAWNRVDWAERPRRFARRQ